MEIFYQEIQKMKRVEARKKLIKTYERTRSISRTAKLWGTSRNVKEKVAKKIQRKRIGGFTQKT